MDRQTIRIYERHGYNVHREKMRMNPDEDWVEVDSAYTKDGLYIGDVERAEYLISKGIKPQLANMEHKVCSIGYSEKDCKWYGWSI